MYRLILLLVAIQAISGHSWCHHSGRRGHRHRDYKKGSHINDQDFHDLSWSVISADRRALRICDEQSPHTTETFYSNHYEISVSLPTFTEEEISVKLTHRVLFIQAIKENESVFSELKIIPDVAKGNAASWTFNNGVLKIHVPYEVTLDTEVVKICNTTIDETVVTIPKSGIDVRFGDDETTITQLDDENVV